MSSLRRSCCRVGRYGAAAVLRDVQPVDRLTEAQPRTIPHRCACAIEARLRRVQPTFDRIEVVVARGHRVELRAVAVLKFELALAYMHGQVAFVNLQMMSRAEQDQIRYRSLAAIGPGLDV